MSPFIISVWIVTGKLSLDKRVKNISTKDRTEFNSLTSLRRSLNISKGNVEAAIESNRISLMPNQIKSMLVFSSTDEISSFTNQAFDACRPRIIESSNSSSDNLVSFINNQQNIPPYPLTEDPMKDYAKFLTFWMNYRTDRDWETKA